MVRPVRVLGAIVMACAALATTGAAQGGGMSFYLGGGATLPMGDYGEYAKTGYMAGIGLGRSLGSGSVFVFVDGFYGKNSHEAEDESTTLIGGGANIGITTMGNSPRFYAYGGLGMQNHKYNPAGGGDGGSETKPYGRASAGISLGSGKVTYWIEAGILQGFGGDDGNTGYMPVLAGISISW